MEQPDKKWFIIKIVNVTNDKFDQWFDLKNDHELLVM